MIEVKFVGQVVGQMASKRCPGRTVQIRTYGQKFVVGLISMGYNEWSNLTNWTIHDTIEDARAKGKEWVGE